MSKNGRKSGKTRNGKKVQKTCIWCGAELTGHQNKYCSKSCKNKFGVNKKRQLTKKKAIEYKGGKCEHCGFDKHHAALTFHHINPKLKAFPISSIGLTRKWITLRDELDKCMLLCSNCHHILHYEENKKIDLPDK